MYYTVWLDVSETERSKRPRSFRVLHVSFVLRIIAKPTRHIPLDAFDFLSTTLLSYTLYMASDLPITYP